MPSARTQLLPRHDNFEQKKSFPQASKLRRPVIWEKPNARFSTLAAGAALLRAASPTINGFGFALYGNSDSDPETRSYVTIHYFVALFIPIFPIARYRVIHEPDSRYRFLGKLPLRTAVRWHLWIAIIAIASSIIGGATNSVKNSSSSPARYGNSSPSNFGTTSAPSFTPSSASSSRCRCWAA